MRFFKTPWLIAALLPGLTWRRPSPTKTIYLTFDDGPVPEVTPFVLTELAKYQARATFFCVGDNIRRYPAVARQVATAGHTLGNHTYHHLKGWDTPPAVYLSDIYQCQAALEMLGPLKKNKLFRPPYGRITPKQIKLLTTDYQVIMWDVLTYDFDKNLASAACLGQAIKNTEPGSIVVFHDSRKAWPNLEFVLPRFLAHFAALGYRFEAL
ncbi:MAG: polysaccharide deacetylase [Adhaeribacter sp.]|nr:polysaccharide deacetylase [Adhaeribacter sp.]